MAPKAKSPDGRRTRVVVLASGAGSTLQALLDAAGHPGYPAEVVAVGADRDGTTALARARAAAVETFVVALDRYPDRSQWDAALAGVVGCYRPDLVVCAGFMKILGPCMLAQHVVVNTHPALLPAFPGTHAVRDALAYGVKVTGATVHLVDEGTDTGPVIAQVAVPVLDGDDETTLHERIKVREREMLVEVVARLAGRGWSVHGRKVTMP